LCFSHFFSTTQNRTRAHGTNQYKQKKPKNTNDFFDRRKTISEKKGSQLKNLWITLFHHCLLIPIFGLENCISSNESCLQTWKKKNQIQDSPNFGLLMYKTNQLFWDQVQTPSKSNVQPTICKQYFGHSSSSRMASVIGILLQLAAFGVTSICICRLHLPLWICLLNNPWSQKHQQASSQVWSHSQGKIRPSHS